MDSKLPKMINIRFQTNKLDETTIKALECLYIENRNDLPFELPALVTWPPKERGITERAEVLIRNGFIGFMENPKDKSNSSPKNNNHTSDNDGFKKRPKTNF